MRHYIEIKNSPARHQISCQKHNLKPILTDCIYRISYKIAKKGKPCEMDLPLLENDITGF